MGTAIETTQGRDADADAGNKRHPTALLSSAYSYAQGSFNSLISPSSRQRAYDAAYSFASKQPILFTFTAFQVLFSLLPLLLFFSFALSTILLALSAAFAFAFFWIGIACLFLIPTLFITASLAILCWGTSVGSFVVARRLFHYAPTTAVQHARDGTQSPKSEDTLVGAEVVVPNGVEVKKEDRFEEAKSAE
ncbi:uncharacterized protein TRIVIDRAFT_67996 [Trichoderma virens Gv29-8]|uniref:Uncharacterized protein n=1 Tax=Hypocrea virens (strain Gv29-8 / FGSC 10586) TaxID=413071 RepID=G9N1G4_HYPVG|nr:uncharacterized protein TRIVIDRAFT_67996 [Trichoderma virens Gv29-8]EHK19594.1 hypothetical protein TRIVIDRAFT_67996 [Trichoderma virens Gv29-8]UKZ58151.1 hypothetical protein TrVGV298_012017 [Trichoderma virens]